MSMLGRLQLILNQDGGIQETVGCARIDQGMDGDGRLAGNQQVDQKGKVSKGRGREGGGGNCTTQPGSYWLGGSFFGSTGGELPSWA